ncbi:MAG: PspA/IM30 family protein [Clostridium sp.]
MGVLKRFGNIMSCKVNSLLSKSKNPLKDVDKYIALLESQLGEIKAEKEAVDVLEKRKKREVLECEDTVDKFQRYVDKSLASNKERDAKRFMEQKNDAEKKLEVLKKEYALIADSNKKMLQMDEKLINDINELKAKKEEIKNKLMQAKSGASVNTKLDEASKNADKALFKAEALAELNNGSYKNSDISDMSIFDELYEDNNAENVNKVELDKNEDSLNSNITENKEQIEQNTSNKAEDDGLDELRKQLGLI